MAKKATLSVAREGSGVSIRPPGSETSSALRQNLVKSRGMLNIMDPASNLSEEERAALQQQLVQIGCAVWCWVFTHFFYVLTVGIS